MKYGALQPIQNGVEGGGIGNAVAEELLRSWMAHEGS